MTLTYSTPIRKAVVPVAGKGTRLKPLTRLLPKELLPLGKKPVLAFVFDELVASGIEEVLLIVSPEKTQIRSVFGDDYSGWEAENKSSLRLAYTVQEKQEGSGDAVRFAEKWTEGETFITAFGDCLIQSDAELLPLGRLIEACKAEGLTQGVLVEKVPPERVSLYGIVSPNEIERLEAGMTARLNDIVEKPPLEQAPSLFAAAARFLLDSTIFRALDQSEKDKRGEKNIPDALRILIGQGEQIGATPLLKGEVRKDIGSLKGYYQEFEAAVRREAVESRNLSG